MPLYLLRLLRLRRLVAYDALLVFPEASEALLEAEVFADDDGCAASAGIFDDSLRKCGKRRGCLKWGELCAL